MLSFKMKGIHFNLEKPHYIFSPAQVFQIKKTLPLRLSWVLKSHYNQEVTKLLLYITLGDTWDIALNVHYYREIASPTAHIIKHGEKNIE